MAQSNGFVFFIIVSIIFIISVVVIIIVLFIWFRKKDDEKFNYLIKTATFDRKAALGKWFLVYTFYTDDPKILSTTIDIEEINTNDHDLMKSRWSEIDAPLDWDAVHLMITTYEEKDVTVSYILKDKSRKAGHMILVPDNVMLEPKKHNNSVLQKVQMHQKDGLYMTMMDSEGRYGFLFSKELSNPQTVLNVVKELGLSAVPGVLGNVENVTRDEL